MTNTYTNLFFHVVFSVKERRSLLSVELREQLYPYMNGIAKNKKFQIISIGGTDDHVHLLLWLPPDISLSKSIQFIKGGSSKWIHDNFVDLKVFFWQEGYGAFTVSNSQMDVVKKYILNQELHHKKMDFEEEYRELLKRNNIEFDERYLF